MSWVVPEVCAVQVVPPLVVAATYPALPDAQHWVAETQLIALMVWVVPEVCAVQVVPPLVVATMVPLAPTAQPSLALAN